MVQGVALITFSINHYCKARQKEFSKKVEISKVESFSWNEFSSDSSCFESEQFLICVLFWQFRGGGLTLMTVSINYCCIIRQKEFSRQTENSKSEFFSSSKFSSDSSCFESEQFFTFFFPLRGVV